MLGGYEARQKGGRLEDEEGCRKEGGRGKDAGGYTVRLRGEQRLCMYVGRKGREDVMNKKVTW